VNCDWVLFHLREALEELQKTIRGIEQDSEYNDGDFYVGMQHLYHHLNTAWNSRDASEEQAAESAEEDFFRWRVFPTDIFMGP